MRELMLGIARPLLRLFGRDERGAIGVLVAILIGGGVLLGMGALAIDVGQLYQNRAELQNGADAAALAVADSCALGNCAPDLAAQYATANASQLTGYKAGVDLVCGSGTGMTACPASTGTMVDCPPAPPAGTHYYADVHTSTRTGGGSTLLPPVLARTLVGNGSYPGTNVKACAQAEWGNPSTANTIAFTISACSWYVYTSDGSSFAQPPPYPPNTAPVASQDHILFEHGSQGSKTTGCPPYQPSGQDAPGNFGWTDDSGSCSTFISAGSYGGSTGASASGDCQTALQNDWANKTLVYLPVYSSISGTGAGVTYTLLGFAAFVVTGYHITGSFKAPDWLNSANNCTGSDFCIDGYFTQGLIPSTGSLGGTDLGVGIVELTG